MRKNYYLSVLTCLLCIPALGQEYIEETSFSSDNIIKKRVWASCCTKGLWRNENNTRI